MMSISAFTYLTVPLAVAISATIRVGNLLGAQQPKQVGEGRALSACLPPMPLLLLRAVPAAHESD